MIKSDLVDEVASQADITKKHAKVIVDTFLHSIIRSLQHGEKVELRGFGSFRIRQRKARVGRNPKTGARVEVPAKEIPYFRAGKELKSLINQ